MIAVLLLLVCVAIARKSDAVLFNIEESLIVTHCKTCKDLTVLLGNSIKNSISQTHSKEMLYKECEKLGIYNHMCNMLVSKYFMDMWVLLLLELEPDTICSKLELCTTPSAVKIDFCPICESIIPQVQVVVDNVSSEVEVCTLLEIFCSQIPYDPDVFAACNSDIQTKLPQLWATLKNCVDNATACCIKLGACKALGSPTNNTPDSIEDSIFSAVQANATCPPLNCTNCEGALAQLQFIVDNNSTEQNIVDLLQLACGELPSPYYQDLCNEFVQKNFSVYWDKLKTCLDNPKNCCTALSVCNSSTINAGLLSEELSKWRLNQN